MAKTSAAAPPVSGNNPCPFLRALVADGLLADHREPIGRVADVVAEVAARGEGSPRLPRAAIAAIALVANGLGPMTLLRTRLHGVQLDGLRGGPLDKRGVGSGILDARGLVDAAELARLGEFAVPCRSAAGRTEPGLRLPQLKRFMDANFARAAGRRRLVDRALMDGEWPVLLKVMGRAGPQGRYLRLKDVQALFTQRRLPQHLRGRA